jgi:hypothetical protein
LKAGLVWILSLACCPLAAWPLLAHTSYRHFSLVCRLGLAAAVGGVLISGWMTLFALAGLAWRTIPLVALAAATAFLLRFLAEPEPEQSPEPARRDPVGPIGGLALAVAAAAVLVALAATASAAATSPDLISFWGAKAQAFAAARTVDASLLRDPLLDYLHVSYPPLVTNLYAFASIAAGRLAWGAATLTFPLSLGALALALPGVLRSVAPRRFAWTASALVVSAFGFLGNELDVAGNGEPWLWLFEVLAMAILVGDAATTAAGQLLAGLLLAGAICAKVEGLPFALAAAVLFLALRRRSIRLVPAAARLLLPGAVGLGAWLVFGATRRLFYGYEQYGRFLDLHWERLGAVLADIGRFLWRPGWALPWLLPLAALLLAPRKTRLALLPIAVAVLLAVFFVFTYLHLPDASLWIEWSAGRVFSPLLALLAIASLCREDDGDQSESNITEC